MRIEPFKLERFFVPYEFSVRHVLCASDCETLSVGELMQLDPALESRFRDLRLAYSPMEGRDELREQIATLHGGAPVEAILVTPGGGTSIELTFRALLEPGDHVVVITPAYQSYLTLPRELGCQVSQVPLEDTAGGWRLDLDRLARTLRGGARALVVNFPHNPTGYLPDRATFGSIASLATGAGARLISDEIFRMMEHDPADRLPSAFNVSEDAIVLGGMSKAFGLPGLRIGWTVARDDRLRNRMLGFLDYAAKDSSAPSQVIAAAALRQSDAVIERNRAIALRNLKLLDGFMTRQAGVMRWHRPRAGVIGAPRLERMRSDALFDGMVAREVLLAPGPLFDMAPAYFRIGFGYDDFPDGLAELERYVVEGSVA